MCSVNFMDTTLSVEEQAVADRIQELKEILGEDLLILGHHYPVSYTHLRAHETLR